MNSKAIGFLVGFFVWLVCLVFSLTRKSYLFCFVFLKRYLQE